MLTTRRVMLCLCAAALAGEVAGCAKPAKSAKPAEPLVPRKPGPEPRASAYSFSAPSQTGAAVSLDDLIKQGPAVLVFYRGYW